MIRIESTRRGPSAVRALKRPEYVPGLLVVRIKEDVVASLPEARTATPAAIKSFRLPSAVEQPFQQLIRKRLLKEVIPTFARVETGKARAVAAKHTALAFASSVQDSENEDLRGINLLRLTSASDVARVEKELKGTRGIEYVHRVPARWLAKAAPAAYSADPMVNRQWGLRAIKWFETDPLPDASGVKVAVLDTGVDTTHPDLQGMVAGYEHGSASAEDIVGHGTHVSGIIAANPNNGVGIAGICRCSLRVWKIFGDKPDPQDDQYYVDELMYQRALNAARNAGVQVMNLSIGGTAQSRTEAMLFRRLIEAGCVVVAAMGNEYQEGNPKEYPAGYPGVVAVGAIDEANRRAPFSNTGPAIAVVAPGTNILSTLPMQPSAERAADETEYAAWDGTSMATPHVTAVAALVRARDPNLNTNQVEAKIKDTATKLDAMKGKTWTKDYGAGLLSLKDAVS